MSPEAIDTAPADVLMSYRDIRLSQDREPFGGRIRAGEIVGLAGLEGQGQEDFLHVLAGLHVPVEGQAWIGQPDTIPVVSQAQVARNGVAYLPRDRRTMGIFPVLSVLDNFGLPSMRLFSRLGVLDRGRQKRKLAEYAEFLAIKFPDLRAPITALSGGNQQKVLLARWLALEPRVLLLNDPTRGVDLNTRLKFYDVFRQLTRESGVALVILSSEIEEILQICSRVLVFRDYQVHSTLQRDETTMDGVLAAMFGQGERRS